MQGGNKVDNTLTYQRFVKTASVIGRPEGRRREAGHPMHKIFYITATNSYF